MDVDLMESLLINLLDNAIKGIGKGRPDSSPGREKPDLCEGLWERDSQE